MFIRSSRIKVQRSVYEVTSTPQCDAVKIFFQHTIVHIVVCVFRTSTFVDATSNLFLSHFADLTSDETLKILNFNSYRS